MGYMILSGVIGFIIGSVFGIGIMAVKSIRNHIVMDEETE